MHIALWVEPAAGTTSPQLDHVRRLCYGDIIGLNHQRGQQPPPRLIGTMRIARRSVMLNEDDRPPIGARRRPKR
jgi:hypothetical protein